MNYFFSIKMLTDLCLFYSILCFLSAWNNSFIFFLISMPLVFINSSICFHFQFNKWIKILSSLITLALLLYIGTPIEKGTAIAFFVYVFILVCTNKFYMEYSDLLTYFKVSSFIVILLFLGSIAFNSNFSNELFFNVLFFILGIFLLRQLRLGDGADKNTRLLDLVTLLGIAGAGSIIGGILYFFLIYKTEIFSTLLSPFKFLLYGFVYIVNAISEWITSIDPEYKAQYEEAMNTETFALPENVEYEYPSMNVNWDVFLYIIGSIIVLLFLFFSIKYLLKTFSNKGIYKSSNQYYEVLDNDEKKRYSRKKEHLSDIRLIYKKYLKLLRGYNYIKAADHTTEDVLNNNISIIEKSATSNSEQQISSAKRLRELYCKSRYRDVESLTSNELTEAKKALEILQNK